MKNLKKCLILNNFMWGVWGMAMLKQSSYTDPNVFNFFFSEGRARVNKHWMKVFEADLK